MTEGLQTKPSFLAMSASRPLSLIDCATCSNEDPYRNPTLFRPLPQPQPQPYSYISALFLPLPQPVPFPEP